MSVRNGVILAVGWGVLLGLASEGRAACVSVGDPLEPSRASLLSLAEIRHLSGNEHRGNLGGSSEFQWWRVSPGHRQEWWVAVPQGMSPPPAPGADGAAPQVCTVSTVPETGGLQVVARLALQQQTSLPPPLASRWFRPPRGVRKIDTPQWHCKSATCPVFEVSMFPAGGRPLAPP